MSLDRVEDEPGGCSVAEVTPRKKYLWDVSALTWRSQGAGRNRKYEDVL